MDAAVNGGENTALGKNRKRMIKEAVLLLLMSTLLYNLGLSVFIFISPLMIYAVTYGNKKAASLIILELLVISALELIKGKPDLTDSMQVISLLISIYFPMSLSAAGIVWLYTSGKRTLKRIIYSLLPVLVISAVYAVPFLVDRALFEETYALYENAFASLMGPMMEPIIGAYDWSFMFYLVVIALASVIVPLNMVAVCASCFIYETAKHSKESGWEDRVRRFEFGQDLIWLLLSSWALVLLNYFISAPEYVAIIILNVAFSSLVLYAVQGFTVLYSWVWKRRREIKSMQLFIVLGITTMLIPGFNFIIIFGLPVLGILESFFDLKKIGVKNEDYS